MALSNSDPLPTGPFKGVAAGTTVAYDDDLRGGLMRAGLDPPAEAAAAAAHGLFDGRNDELPAFGCCGLPCVACRYGLFDMMLMWREANVIRAMQQFGQHVCNCESEMLKLQQQSCSGTGCSHDACELLLRCLPLNHEVYSRFPTLIYYKIRLGFSEAVGNLVPERAVFSSWPCRWDWPARPPGQPVR